MDIEDPRWEEYEARFRALAEAVGVAKGPQPELASAEMMLFLYGENGLAPEQEFDMLAKLEVKAADLKGTEMQTAYWEDIVLYLPDPS
ncbi:hypothetical protein [Vampirovibrio chlorellavorus]|uniref:hypothetical protein n=1 Tax=Vampirovibrio chlorellavorus TaxID=758823 RepID=UPI0026ECFAC2|nr:hypothetical protein [Vampirovibrio chlorellavorus]